MNMRPIIRIAAPHPHLLPADRRGGIAAGVIFPSSAGGARMVAKAEGISKVIVNGTLLYTDGKHTGAFLGQVLRPK